MVFVIIRIYTKILLFEETNTNLWPMGSYYSIFKIIIYTAMLTSVPFLLATFIVYAILPELRNVHGKSLMCYLMGLAMGYTILAMVQIKLHWDPEIMCNILGYTVYTAFMSAFFWLNVISFDLWWNFR